MVVYLRTACGHGDNYFNLYGEITEGGKMKAGTIVKMADGRIGTVVYNGYDGRGIRWGRHELTPEIEQNLSLWFDCGDIPPEAEVWLPEAMLRDSYVGCEPDLEYIGDSYEVIHA